MGVGWADLVAECTNHRTFVATQWNYPWADPHVDGIVATLVSPVFTVEVDVPSAFGDGLDAFFKDIDEQWRGWDEPLTWQSLGGHLSIVATDDGRGHVTLDVRGRDQRYSGPIAPWSTWDVGVRLIIDVGSFDQLAHELAEFFRDGQRSSE